MKGRQGTLASQSLFPSAPTGSLDGSLFFGGGDRKNDSVLGLQSLLVATAKRLVTLTGTWSVPVGHTRICRRGVFYLDDGGNNLDATGNPRIFRSFLHQLCWPLRWRLSQRSSQVPDSSLHWRPSLRITLRFLTPSPYGGPSALRSLSPVTAMEIQCPSNAKCTAFGEADGHYRHMVGKPLTLKLGRCFWSCPAGRPLTGSPWRALSLSSLLSLF